jgi:flagellar operon protein
MRGIQFTPQGLQRIEQAVDRAAEKGSRDALVVAGGLALVVSVENRTVVTVMSRDAMQESVVTNIDSAVFA